MALRCDELDALIPAFLDGELAGQEHDDLEHHVDVCAACRARVDGERAGHEALRAALRAPAAPAALRDRVVAGLDRADQLERGGARRWVLPAAAALAAAAALGVFGLDVANPVAPTAGISVADVQHDAVASHFQVTPTLVTAGSQSEVSRSVGAYLQVPVMAPQLGGTANLRGWQPTRLAGRIAAKLVYEVKPATGRTFRVDVDILPARDLRLDARDSVQVEGTRMWVLRTLGINTVATRDASGVAYVVTSDMPRGQLLDLLLDSDLLANANQRVFGR